MLEQEEAARLEEHEERRQFSRDALAGTRQHPRAGRHQREHGVAHVAEEEVRGQLGQRRKRRIGICGNAAAREDLRGEHFCGHGSVDVRVRHRIRIDPVPQGFRPTLLDDPDVDPRTRAGPQHGDSHQDEAGEQKEEARLHQRSAQVHAEIRAEQDQRRERQPAKAALQRARVGVEGGASPEMTGESEGASSAEHDLRRKLRLAGRAAARPERGGDGRRACQRGERQRALAVQSVSDLRQRAENGGSSGELHSSCTVAEPRNRVRG